MIYIGDVNADRALCFSESSVIDGSMSLFVDGDKSGAGDEEGRGVMRDRGGYFWPSSLL